MLSTHGVATTSINSVKILHCVLFCWSSYFFSLPFSLLCYTLFSKNIEIRWGFSRSNINLIRVLNRYKNHLFTFNFNVIRPPLPHSRSLHAVFSQRNGFVSAAQIITMMKNGFKNFKNCTGVHIHVAHTYRYLYRRW